MQRLLVIRILLWGCIVTLNACSPNAHKTDDWVYRYTLVATEPLEHYGVKGIRGPRNQDIPVGDTLVAESASFLTGIPAYSQVIYQQKEAWVFGALSKTRVVKKSKVTPTYSKNLPVKVIYKAR